MEEMRPEMHAPQRNRTLHDYFWILIKRRWLILLVFFAIVAYTTLKNFTETPMYTATVQILIERQTPHYINQPEASSQYDYSGEEFYQTHYKLIESPRFGQKSGRKT